MTMRLIAVSLILSFAISMQSCEKELTPVVERETITRSLKVNEGYQFDLGAFGDEEGAAISIQANHFFSSDLHIDVNTGRITYTYRPARDFIGSDEVEIRSARGSNGASQNNKISFTVIKFTIKD